LEARTMSATWKLLAGAFIVVVASAGASGATLGLDETKVAREEQQVRVPVVLSVGEVESVAGFQFDLRFEPLSMDFVSAETGASAVAGEKSAHANMIRPGRLRVVVAGFNRNSIAEGEVATLVFAIKDAGGEAAALRLSDVVLSDPFGTPVTVRVSPDTLIVTEDSAKAVSTGAGQVAGGTRESASLYRYRAILFAGVVVGFTMIFARPKSKKGRAR